MAMPPDDRELVVGIKITYIHPELGYLCERDCHPEDDNTLATVHVEKPEMDPPLVGPDHYYLCDQCLNEFLELCGVFAVIL